MTIEDFKNIRPGDILPEGTETEHQFETETEITKIRIFLRKNTRFVRGVEITTNMKPIEEE